MNVEDEDTDKTPTLDSTAVEFVENKSNSAKAKAKFTTNESNSDTIKSSVELSNTKFSSGSKNGIATELSCDLCQKTFFSKKRIIHHMRVHEKKLAFKKTK